MYRPPGTSPIAVFDQAAFPIHDVAFHPSHPIAAIATGSYDGGYCFEGQLLLWDWQTRRSADLARQIPEVSRVRFSDDGKTITAIVRPWSDQEDNFSSEDDPFQLFFALTLALGDGWPAPLDTNQVAAQIARQTPRSLPELVAQERFSALPDPQPEITRALDVEAVRSRSPIWDVAFTDAGAIAAVHDDCLLELSERDGSRTTVFKGEGHGVQIFLRPHLLVHASHLDKQPSGADWHRLTVRTALLTHTGDTLSPIATLEGAYTFSASREGRLLGRLNRRHGYAKPAPGASDVIIDPRSGDILRHDLGHYDAVNHYLRIDGSPDLFFIQGTPPESHQNKFLCAVSPQGEVRRLWPLSPEGAHAMECCFAYVNDARGEGIVTAWRHYDSPGKKPNACFIQRQALADGALSWRHPAKASATSIRPVPGKPIILAAFLDGSLAAFQSETGDILTWEPLRIDGLANVAFSLDADQSHVALGLLDGRYGLAELSRWIGA